MTRALIAEGEPILAATPRLAKKRSTSSVTTTGSTSGRGPGSSYAGR